jgi:TatD DNase family protein
VSHTSGILSDTHCHLTAAEFDSDRSQVLQRAREFHIHRILTPGIDIPSSQKAIELADQYNEIYAAIGVHPHAANHWHASMVDTLRTMASHHKVIAIGEIGLDYYRDITPGMKGLSFEEDAEYYMPIPWIKHPHSKR